MKLIFDRSVRVVSGISLALIGLALVDFLLHPLGQDYLFQSAFYRAVVILVLTPLNLLAGFLIIRRVPGNIVGPLFIVWSGTVAYGSIRGDMDPRLFALFYYYDMIFGWAGFMLMLAHFPSGEIHPPVLAPWIYRLLGFTILVNNLMFFSTAILQVPSQMANPYLMPALQPYAGLISGIAILVWTPLLVLILLSPVLRYRKGNYRERQQIKWLALFTGSFLLYVLVGLIVYPLLTGGPVMYPGNSLFALIFYITVGLFPPLAIGVAVLRHRLWDLDLIIRRTLVYSTLTVILSMIYFTSVTLLQELFTTASGQQSPTAVVLSTLVIAASFTPLRRAIQERIDRRFYRRKYDAEQVMTSFSRILKEEVDLDYLTNSIQGVVEGTLQPAHVSLWLRQAGGQNKTPFSEATRGDTTRD
jgi:hypothetical protein